MDEHEQQDPAERVFSTPVVPPVSAPPAPAQEWPVHLDDFIRAHAREFGPELRGMFRHVAAERGHMVDTISGFKRALEAFKSTPIG